MAELTIKFVAELSGGEDPAQVLDAAGEMLKKGFQMTAVENGVAMFSLTMTAAAYLAPAEPARKKRAAPALSAAGRAERTRTGQAPVETAVQKSPPETCENCKKFKASKACQQCTRPMCGFCFKRLKGACMNHDEPAPTARPAAPVAKAPAARKKPVNQTERRGLSCELCDSPGHRELKRCETCSKMCCSTCIRSPQTDCKECVERA